MAVATAYSEAGFDDKGPWGPCDHLAYELRFMASLCNAEAESIREGSAEETEWARERQVRFLDEHLLAWVPAYCEHISERSEEALYQALARVTKRIVLEDARYLHGKHLDYGAGTDL
jgi:TorA maturation chaperone TorD